MKLLEYFKLGKMANDYALLLSQMRPSYYFSIPCEIVAESPIQLLTNLNNWPTGRGWFLHKWRYNGNIIPYEELSKVSNFRGTSHYPALYMVEHWADYGDDGHTAYRIIL